MNFNIILLILFCSSLYAETYTFEQLHAIAQKNDIATEIEKTKILELDARINKLRADYYPHLSIVLGSEKREAKSEPDVSKNNFVGEFRVDYNLYRFGATSDKINALQTLRIQQEHNIKLSEIKLRQNLSIVFNECLFHKYKLDTIKEEIKYNEKLKTQVAKKEAQGLVGKADILEIDMREATLKFKLLEIEENYQHKLDELRKIAKLDHEKELIIQGDIPHEHFTVKIDDLVKAAYKNNKSHMQIFAKMNSLENELDSAKAEYLPEITLSGRYGKMRIDEQYADDSLEGLVGIYVNIPLFSGGKNSSNVDLYKTKLASEKLRYNSSEHNLKINISHLYEKMLNIHEQVDLTEKNYENSKIYFDNVNKEYLRGIKNSLDLVSARDRMIDFNISYVYSKKEFIKAKIKLEEATGVSF